MRGYNTIAVSPCNITVWNASNPTACVGSNGDGTPYPGICGMDSRCWTSGVNFEGVTTAGKKTYLESHSIVI